MEHAVVFGLSKQAVLAMVTGVFAAIALLMFARGIARGSSRPYMWAWLIRFGLCGLAFVSQAAGGATYSLALSGGQLISTVIIIGLIAYYCPRRGKLDGAERLGIALACLGAVVWLVSGDPLYGLAGALVAEVAATTMGIRAGIKKGTTDSWSFWLCCLLAGIAALLAADSTYAVVVLAPVFSCMNAAANIIAVWYVRQRHGRRRDQLVASTEPA